MGDYMNQYGTGVNARRGRAHTGAQQGAEMGSAFGPWGMAIGGAIGGVKGFLEEPGAYEKANLQRLDQLAAEREAGALGLTERERRALYGEQEARVRMGDEMLGREQGAALAAGGLGAGQAMAAASQMQERRNLAQQQIAQSVLAADIARQREKDDEYFARLADVEGRQVNQRTQQRQTASEMGQAIEGEMAARDTIEGESADNDAARAQLTAEYGMSDEEAGSWLQAVAQNPELATYLQRFGG